MLTAFLVGRSGPARRSRRLLLDAGESGRARELLEAAIGSGNPQVVPMAQDLLGDLLAEQEDWEGAQDAYQAAIDTADPYWAPVAQASLGALLLDAGESGRARELLEAAIGSGNPDVVPQAQDLLRDLLAQ
jgi:tetratricopeptide (TPR) repeat protein